MHYRSIILLFVLFVTTNCQRDSLGEVVTSPGGDEEIGFRQSFPELLSLPNGFAPEGIVDGDGDDFYVGSLATGAIYKGDFRTGAGEIIYTPASGPSVGLAFDQRTKYLYIAGGNGGGATVIDTRSGTEISSHDFGGGFVNDVIITNDGAYFTDSALPNIYKIPLSSRGTPAGSFTSLTLSGDFEQTAGFNANGIEALPDGSALIIVKTNTGELFHVDPDSGEATLIDLNGESVGNGDGLLRVGKTLYVVQNFINQIGVVQLSSDYRSGTVMTPITDGDFDIPTTVTRHGGTLYAVNARFTTTPGPGVAYDVVKVDE